MPNRRNNCMSLTSVCHSSNSSWESELETLFTGREKITFLFLFNIHTYYAKNVHLFEQHIHIVEDKYM